MADKSGMFYCCRCKQMRKGIDVKEFKTKNGKNAMRGKCSVCGANVVKFVKQ